MKQKNIWITILASCAVFSSCKEEFDDIAPISLSADDTIKEIKLSYVDDGAASLCTTNSARVEVFGKVVAGERSFSTKPGQATNVLKAQCAMFQFNVYTQKGNHQNTAWETDQENVGTVLDNCDVVINTPLKEATSDFKYRYIIKVTSKNAVTAINTTNVSHSYLGQECGETGSQIATTKINTRNKYKGAFLYNHNTGAENEYNEIFVIDSDSSGFLKHTRKLVKPSGENIESGCQVNEQAGDIVIFDHNTGGEVTATTTSTSVKVNCSTIASEAKTYSITATGDLSIEGNPLIYKKVSSFIDLNDEAEPLRKKFEGVWYACHNCSGGSYTSSTSWRAYYFIRDSLTGKLKYMEKLFNNSGVNIGVYCEVSEDQNTLKYDLSKGQALPYCASAASAPRIHGIDDAGRLKTSQNSAWWFGKASEAIFIAKPWLRP